MPRISLALTTWVAFQRLGKCRLLPVTRKSAPAASAHSGSGCQARQETLIRCGQERPGYWQSAGGPENGLLPLATNFRPGYESTCPYSLRSGPAFPQRAPAVEQSFRQGGGPPCDSAGHACAYSGMKTEAIRRPTHCSSKCYNATIVPQQHHGVNAVWLADGREEELHSVA
jgi:hypothetical protein